MKILVVGLGSIGRRHIKNLKKIDPNLEIAVLRMQHKISDLGDLSTLVTQIFFDVKRAKEWQPQVVMVCNPAGLHLKVASDFIDCGSHFFIEKPIDVDSKRVKNFIKACENKKLIVMVGYCLRFLEPLTFLKREIEAGRIGKPLMIRSRVGRNLMEWRPGTDYRNNVSAQKSLGGGVVYELSHELDYARWLMGEVVEVSAVLDKVSDFEMDVEDAAEITLKFANHSVGHISMDMLDWASNRSCRVIGEEGTMVWEYFKTHRVRLFSKDTGQWQDVWQNEGYDYNQMYVEQFKHFFDCIGRQTIPSVSAQEGLRILEIALAAKESSSRKRMVQL